MFWLLSVISLYQYVVSSYLSDLSGIGQMSTYITNHPSSSGKVIHKHQTAERVFWKAPECYFPLIGSSAYREKFFLIRVLPPRSVKEQGAENLPDWNQIITSWILIKSSQAYEKWEYSILSCFIFLSTRRLSSVLFSWKSQPSSFQCQSIMGESLFSGVWQVSCFIPNYYTFPKSHAM